MDRFYISDLDKTILNDNAQLSNSSKEKIKLILRNNIKFTVASARSFNSIKNLFKGIELPYPIIELNGAMITDFKTEKHHIINSINHDIIDNIINYAQKKSLHPFYTVINEDNISNLYPPVIINEGNQWFIDDRIRNKDPRLRKNPTDIKELKNKRLLSVTFIYKLEELLLLKEYLDTFEYKNEISVDFFENPYSNDWQWLTVLSNRSQKGKAINKLKEVLNLDNHEIIVFGDNHNDYNMFKNADRSYAVKNAKKKLKEIATDIIGYNYEDAVLDFILKENEIEF
jgi:hypothetical protein